uniref:Retrovirus-related Pol polyprotein from transposon TNT 1-94 n=1 Tax=Trichuris muris TaxID=70415 RepID=A0A5S6R2Q3_TRIMR
MEVKDESSADERWPMGRCESNETGTSASRLVSTRVCKAIAAICLTVEYDQLLHLTQLETAREMWQALQRLHERSTIGSRLCLKRKLYSMRFTHGTMQSHLNAMLEIVAQLREMGKNTEDDDLVAVMLCSLPDSYSALITDLEGRDEADLTVEYVSDKLLDENQRRVENSSDQSSSETALKSTARNEQGQDKSMRKAWNRSTNSLGAATVATNTGGDGKPPTKPAQLKLATTSDLDSPVMEPQKETQKDDEQRVIVETAEETTQTSDVRLEDVLEAVKGMKEMFNILTHTQSSELQLFCESLNKLDGKMFSIIEFLRAAEANCAVVSREVKKLMETISQELKTVNHSLPGILRSL